MKLKLLDRCQKFVADLYRALPSASLLSVALGAIAFSGGSTHAAGAFGFDLDDSSVPTDKLPQVRAFLAEVEQKLPEEVKTTIGLKIKLSFTNFGSNAPLKVDCDKSDDSKNPHSSVSTGFVAGKYDKRGIFTREKIQINSGFIQEIVNGPQGATRIDCGHGNFYRMAVGALIHEVLHAYDLNDPLTSQEKSELDAQCDPTVIENNGLNSRCTYLKTLTTKVSKRNNYLSLANWRAGMGALIQKNTIKGRSPESYELDDPEEHFALNGEYFLTDPEYACRKPAFNRFFSSLFKTDPYAGKRDCENRSQVRLETGGYTQLDPKRIYQIQYLKAGPGNDTSSHWGHAMIRLVVCAPWRDKPGPECLQDVQNHIVVSYRANVNDIKMNPVKGVTGAYDSRAFFFSMKSIMNEYGDTELRDLESYPLKLSESQKELLVDHLTEQFWTYRGKYYFATNNCATETLELIKSAISDDNGIQSEASLVKSPEGLLTLLKRNSLIDNMPQTRQEKINQGYFYPSKRKKVLTDAFGRIRKLVPSMFSTMEDYVFKSTAAERKAILDELMKSNQLDKAAVASFLDLEIQCSAQLDIDTKKRIQKYLETQVDTKGKDGKTDDIGAKLKEFIELDRKVEPWNIVKKDSGYGVPIKGEIDACVIESTREKMNDFVTTLDEITQRLFPDIANDRTGIEENLKFLFGKLNEPLKNKKEEKAGP